MLNTGDIAPEFSLPNEDGVQISLQDFIDRIVVLYFYPRNDTPGCTLQALDFTKYYEELLSYNAVVVGISQQNQESCKNFVIKHGLKLILLSDDDKSVARKYFAFGERRMYGKQVQGIIRSVFIIENNKIKRAFYNIKAKDSAKKVLDFLKS